MKFCVLSSGSKGNCTYIETTNTKVLIDAGISFLEFTKRAKVNNIDISNIKGIFITHEHTDHIKGLATFVNKLNTNVYITKESYKYLSSDIKTKIDSRKIKIIEENRQYNLDDLEILTLKLSHDSKNCLGYSFISENKVLTYVTDTGYFPTKYLDILRISDSIIIEANHDIEMLMNSNRPQDLKKRILSEIGHMSNKICVQVLMGILTIKQKIIVLAHLSEECNDIDIVQDEIINTINEKYKVNIYIANQYVPTDLLEF